jgi:hypothetical protein
MCNLGSSLVDWFVFSCIFLWSTKSLIVYSSENLGEYVTYLICKERKTYNILSDDLDRSHGFIAPRLLYTGPLCPTFE